MNCVTRVGTPRDTNPSGRKGDLHDALHGADVFFGLSAPDC